MKVQLNWVAKVTNATRRVDGPDLESVLKALSARDEWAAFDYDLQSKWEYDGQGFVNSITLQPKFSITMPAWPAYRNQPQSCKDKWDAMWRALRKHEDGHRELFENAVSRLVAKLEAQGPIKEPDLKALVKQAISDHGSEQVDYDTRTDHGKSQSVELVISPECQAKQKNE